jgi:hypothetical protein
LKEDAILASGEATCLTTLTASLFGLVILIIGLHGEKVGELGKIAQ